MNIFNLEFAWPKEAFAKDFVLFPTNVDFSYSDYQIVMANREYLRLWSQSSWPEDHFTAEQNAEDLKFHIEDNKNHAAYGFMIYSLDRKTCFGSIYVNPLKSVLKNYDITEAQIKEISKSSARIDCWIDQNLQTHFEKQIIEFLINWFKQTWKVKAIFTARPGMSRRIDIYESLGLENKMNLKSHDGSQLAIFDERN